jgi:hypothetical protein
VKRRAITAAVLAAAIVAACSGPTVPEPTVWFENGTNTPMAVHLNGGWIGTYGPGTASDVHLRGANAPYRVTIHAPSGSSVLELELSAEEVATRAANLVGTGLPCGTLRLSFGLPHEPSLDPVGAGTRPCP